MDDEIQLISDGDGLAVIGDPSKVERFLRATGLWAASRELDLHRVQPLLRTAADVAQSASEVSANSGRWMRLTKDSAKVAKKFALVKDPKTGNSYATAKATAGSQFVKNLQFEGGPGKLLTNPAALSGVAGIMAQVAGQQAIGEITEYLTKIDANLDDIRRSQRNQVLARMDGVALAIREAASVRASVGRTSEITWSKLQDTSTTILETQAYASRQLQDLADKLEKKTKVGALAKAAKDAETEVQVWLAVLARCFQLQDAIADLELDHVLDTAPHELDQHRLGLKAARQSRLELFAKDTEYLLERIDATVASANDRLFWARAKSLAIVQSGNFVANEIDDFHETLRIEAESRSWSPRQLGPAVERSALAIQKAKDGAPAALAVGSLAALAAAVKKRAT